MSAEQITDEQLFWEYMKCQIRYLFAFQKKVSKKRMPKLRHYKVKELEQKPDCMFDCSI